MELLHLSHDYMQCLPLWPAFVECFFRNQNLVNLVVDDAHLHSLFNNGWSVNIWTEEDLKYPLIMLM